jgi:hypothetical protein
MKIEIRHRTTSAVLFTRDCEDNTAKLTLEAAVTVGANLSVAYVALTRPEVGY